MGGVGVLEGTEDGHVLQHPAGVLNGHQLRDGHGLVAAGQAAVEGVSVLEDGQELVEQLDLCVHVPRIGEGNHLRSGTDKAFFRLELRKLLCQLTEVDEGGLGLRGHSDDANLLARLGVGVDDAHQREVGVPAAAQQLVFHRLVLPARGDCYVSSRCSTIFQSSGHILPARGDSPGGQCRPNNVKKPVPI